MSSEWVGKLSRLQRSRVFKIVASVVVVALGLIALGTYIARQTDLNRDRVMLRGLDEPEGDAAKNETAEEKATRELVRSGAEADVKYINNILSAQADWSGVALLIVEASALVLALIWLGLGLSGIGLLGLIALVAWRLKLFQGGVVQLEELTRVDIAFLFLGAVAVLTVSFVVLMEFLKFALSAAYPVTAVARNVVNEAVRLKISLVFIVLLIFGLAALPGMLDASTPLRYRVQAFLSYSTSGTFWLVALLTVFLSVGSVAFEQRDRIIWQTMTKPVSAWQYVLGKWLGVVSIAAVLLAVSGSGIFVFTDFLSRQKAVEEVKPFVAGGGRVVTEDRRILQGQVLTARRMIRPELPEIDEGLLKAEVEKRIEQAKRDHPEEIPDSQKVEKAIRKEFQDQIQPTFFALDPEQSQIYTFKGLNEARKVQWMSPEAYAKKTGRSLDDVNKAITEKRLLSRVTITGGDEVMYVDVRSVSLRYKVQAGGNDPRATARVSFEFMHQPQPEVRVVPLNTSMVMEIPPSAIDENGDLHVQITNGDIVTRTTSGAAFVFPPDGLEVRFSVGSYQNNFARVMMILWLKIAFLAMGAITASTFLSFPVAAMMAFGLLFVAETAGYLWESLNNYDAGEGGKLNVFRIGVKIIAVPIAYVFRYYADINPIENLADGRLVNWLTVAWAAVIMLGAALVLYAIGVGVFRRRELATYSGQ